MSTNGNGVILLPGQQPMRHGLSAAEREEERLALVAHVEALTAQVNALTKACGALIQAQRACEAARGDTIATYAQQGSRINAIERTMARRWTLGFWARLRWIVRGAR